LFFIGPGNYANPVDFMAGEGFISTTSPGSGVVPLPLDGKTSSKMISFGDRPVSLAIPRLIGCTSVIVVSKKGVWANHIWELPIFRPEENFDAEGERQPGWLMPGLDPERPVTLTFPYAEQQAFFKEHALDTLHRPYEGGSPDHETGLDSLRQSGGLFDDSSEFKVFMFAPYLRVEDENDPNFGKENPVGLPLAWDRPGFPNPRADEGGPTLNERIQSELRSILGQNVPITAVPYAPDDEGDPLDDGFDLHRGRALIQYQPGDINSCENSKAQWRIYFEGAQEPRDTDDWDPLDSQFCQPGGNSRRGIKRRQACSVSFSRSQTASATASLEPSQSPSTTLDVSTSEPVTVAPTAQPSMNSTLWSFSLTASTSSVTVPRFSLDLTTTLIPLPTGMPTATITITV
jgi:hypothetical protein